jgi:hypothetical protein
MLRRYISNFLGNQTGSCWACMRTSTGQRLLYAEMLLYRLSNEKPSAIFKLRTSPAPSVPSPQTDNEPANLGILCEPIASVQAQVASNTSNGMPTSGALVTTGSSRAGSAAPSDSLVIAQKCAKNFLNYLSSFVQSAPAGSSIQTILSDPSAQSALLGLCERWYKGLESKTQMGIDWLNKEQD